MYDIICNKYLEDRNQKYTKTSCCCFLNCELKTQNPIAKEKKEKKNKEKMRMYYSALDLFFLRKQSPFYITRSF